MKETSVPIGFGITNLDNPAKPFSQRKFAGKSIVIDDTSLPQFHHGLYQHMTVNVHLMGSNLPDTFCHEIYFSDLPSGAPDAFWILSDSPFFSTCFISRTRIRKSWMRFRKSSFRVVEV